MGVHANFQEKQAFSFDIFENMNGVKKDFYDFIFFKEKVPVKRKFFIQGKEKNVLVIRKFVLSEFALSGN